MVLTVSRRKTPPAPSSGDVSTPPLKGKFRFRASNPISFTLPPPISSNVSDYSGCPATPPDEIDEPVVQDAAPTDYHDPIDENDIVIAVMGPTGAGKSSFVKMATENKEVAVGHNLVSKTRNVRAIRCTYRRDVVLVDTPGFDDTYQSDVEILRTTAKWLKDTYQKNIKLAGILYLHRISDVRMAGTPLRNLKVFKDLCGDDNLKNIVLVTTMWDEVKNESIGSERETELRSDFWKDMIYLGSRTFRYEGTHESAWKIINGLDLETSFQRRAPLQIQQEMVDRGFQLHETSAGKTLFRSLGEEVKNIWARMRGRARRPINPGRPSGGLRQIILRRSSIKSISSEASRSVTSLSDTFSVASSSSTRPSSIADSTASGCSAIGRREALSAMIRGLRIVHEAAELVPFPFLKGSIGVVLVIGELIQEMNGTHHAISHVVENAGWLLEEITRYAIDSRLSDDLKRCLKFFERELKHLLNVVKKIGNRGPVARFLLHEADIQAISECDKCIRAIYEKLGVKIAMESYQAIGRLQEEITHLRNDRESWTCQCGSLVVREEDEDFFDAASHASSSSRS